MNKPSQNRRKIKNIISIIFGIISIIILILTINNTYNNEIKYIENKKLDSLKIRSNQLDSLIKEFEKKGNKLSKSIKKTRNKSEQITIKKEKELLDGVTDYIEGKTSYHVPDSMQLKQLSKVSLSIGNDLEYLIERTYILSKAKSKEKIKSGDITIGRRMKATLIDPMEKIDKCFIIKPITTENQIIDLHNNKSTDWIWNVLPLKIGKHELDLTLEVMLKNDLGENYYSIPVFNDKITVFIQIEDIPIAYQNIEEGNKKLNPNLRMEKVSPTSPNVKTDENTKALSSTRQPQNTEKIDEESSYPIATTSLKLKIIYIFLILGVIAIVGFLAFRRRNIDIKKIQNEFSIQDISKLENLCKENQIEEALQIIISKMKNSNNALRKEAILNHRNLKHIKKENLQNLINFDDYNRSMSKISLATINLVDEIKKSV